MANIYNFPDGVRTSEHTTTEHHQQHDAAGGTRPQGVPDVVWDAVCSVRDMPRIPGVLYHEIPVSRDLCDFGIGVEIALADETVISPSDPETHYQYSSEPTGWINMLYSKQPRYGWDSCWRCAAFIRVTLENGEDDGLTPAMFWDETTTNITAAVPGTLSETVSISQDTAFSGVSADPETLPHRRAGCELRMSWTPQASAHNGLDTGCEAGNDVHIDAGEQIACLANLLRSTVQGGTDARAN